MLQGSGWSERSSSPQKWATLMQLISVCRQPSVNLHSQDNSFLSCSKNSTSSIEPSRKLYWTCIPCDIHITLIPIISIISIHSSNKMRHLTNNFPFLASVHERSWNSYLLYMYAMGSREPNLNMKCLCTHVWYRKLNRGSNDKFLLS